MHTYAHARMHAKIQRAMHLYMYSLDLCMHRSVRTRPELRKVLPLSRQQNHQIHNKFIIKLIVSGRPTKSLNSGFWSTCPKLYEFYYEFVVVFIKLVTGKGGVLFSGQGAYASTYACQDRSVERSMHAVPVHVHLGRGMTRYQLRLMHSRLKRRLETRSKKYSFNYCLKQWFETKL